jgi:hypothetical protein
MLAPNDVPNDAEPVEPVAPVEPLALMPPYARDVLAVALRLASVIRDVQDLGGKHEEYDTHFEDAADALVKGYRALWNTAGEWARYPRFCTGSEQEHEALV